MVAKVVAYMEFDPEELIEEVAREYEEEVSEVTMDDIVGYINENVTYLSNRNNRNKWYVGDGWSIDGFEEHTYDEIADVLERMQEREDETEENE